MSDKVLFQGIIVSLFVSVKHGLQPFAVRIKDGTEGHVQDLPPIEKIQHTGQRIVGQGFWRRHLTGVGRHVIRGAVHIVAGNGQRQNLAEKPGIDTGDGAQRLQAMARSASR